MKKIRLNDPCEKLIKERIKYLKKLMGRHLTIWTAVKNVSSSGMSRHISLFIVDKKREIHNISCFASDILGWKTNKSGDALVVGGCGMDMGFHTVYALSRKMFSKRYKDSGYKIKQKWV